MQIAYANAEPNKPITVSKPGIPMARSTIKKSTTIRIEKIRSERARGEAPREADEKGREVWT